MNRTRVLSALACAASLFALAAPDPAAADSLSPARPAGSAPYGTYPYEGEFPGPDCPAGMFQPIETFTKGVPDVNGNLQGVTLQLLYYDKCGAYATMTFSDDSDQMDCWVFIDRSDDGGATFVNSAERQQSAGGFTESRIANDLNGRVARGALVCNGGIVFGQTNWY